MKRHKPFAILSRTGSSGPPVLEGKVRQPQHNRLNSASDEFPINVSSFK